MQYHNLGKYIRNKREKIGVSLNTFSFDNDIDSSILSRIETQQQDIKFGVLVKIAQGFGMTVGEFIMEFENYDKKTT